MIDLLKQLAGSRAGLAVVLAGGAALVGGGVVAHDSAEGQGAGLAGAVLVAAGLARLWPRVLAWVRERSGAGGPPPVGPAS